MKILQVSSSAGIGGAGIAAYRLHKGLRSLSVDSWMLVDAMTERAPFVIGPGTLFDKVMARSVPILDRIPGKFLKPGMDRVSSSWMPNRLLSRVKSLAPDLINLHWVCDGFMRLETLPKLRTPIVWTMHDMWAFVGGEHYVGADERYKRGYTANNRPKVESGIDVNRWIWERKSRSWRALDLDRFAIVTPSRWLADCVRDSKIFRNFRVEVLPNGIDEERFRPFSHDIVREILGLPFDKKLILFGAVSASSDKRKGYHLLDHALKALEQQVDPEAYELIVFGALSGDNTSSIATRYLGNFHDEISMSLLYAAADVFLAPSLEDNLPNTVLESLSCGTPVVAFDIGGMPDMIEHQKNGYLARSFDIDDFVKGMRWVLDDVNWPDLARRARQTVLDKFTLTIAASNYAELYKDLIA